MGMWAVVVLVGYGVAALITARLAYPGALEAEIREGWSRYLCERWASQNAAFAGLFWPLTALWVALKWVAKSGARKAVTVHMRSPVVTAQTREELGRELDALVKRGGRLGE